MKKALAIGSICGFAFGLLIALLFLASSPSAHSTGAESFTATYFVLMSTISGAMLAATAATKPSDNED